MCALCEETGEQHEEFLRQLGDVLDKAIFAFGEQQWGPTPPELIPPAFRRAPD